MKLFAYIPAKLLHKFVDFVIQEAAHIAAAGVLILERMQHVRWTNIPISVVTEHKINTNAQCHIKSAK
jgi:hypothetical protein